MMVIIKPVLSIAMITYNQVEYIKQALESALKQKTNFEYEICIGDDGSDDGTREICGNYAEKYPEIIRLFNRDRSNPLRSEYAAPFMFNFLETLKSCRGKYIAILEGDDFWTDGSKLQTQIQFMEKNPDYSGIFHETRTIGPLSENFRVFGRHEKLDFDVQDTIAVLSPFHTSSFLFRKKCLPSEFPYWFKKIISADMSLFMIIASQGRLRRIPRVMSNYRRHDSGITSKTNVHEQHDSTRIELMQYFDEFLDNKWTKKIKSVIQLHEKELKRKRMKRPNLIERIKMKIAPLFN